MHRKILIMGLPGAGKTTLTAVLAPLLNAWYSMPTPCAPMSRAISALVTRIAWSIERITLDETIEAISATNLRILGAAP